MKTLCIIGNEPLSNVCGDDSLSPGDLLPAPLSFIPVSINVQTGSVGVEWGGVGVGGNTCVQRLRWADDPAAAYNRFNRFQRQNEQRNDCVSSLKHKTIAFGSARADPEHLTPLFVHEFT